MESNKNLPDLVVFLNQKNLVHEKSGVVLIINCDLQFMQLR